MADFGGSIAFAVSPTLARALNVLTASGDTARITTDESLDAADVGSEYTILYLTLPYKRRS